MTAPSDHVPWRHSLIVRVIGLCVALFVCLLASMYGLTRYSFHRIAEARAADLARNFQFYLESRDGTDADPETIRELMKNSYEDLYDLTLEDPGSAPRHDTRIQASDGADGTLIILASSMVMTTDGPLRMDAYFLVPPQADLLRPFEDRFLTAVTAIFVVMLLLLVYFIYRTLRPLQDLTRSIARIGEGELGEVAVRENMGEVAALEKTFNSMVRSLREKEVVETNLRQAQRLSALGNLAAGVAHDIRNPLNAIKLLSSHAIDTLEKKGDAAGAGQKLETIRREVDRLEDIVSGFLSLAKEHELRRAPCPIDEVLRECVRLVEKDAEARGVRLVCDLRAGDTLLDIDRKHWNRALLNVLINAMEATPPGGRVRLFSRLTDLACEIEIRDDGPGMAPEAAERAFEPYYTTKATGTGLGLSITRGIVEEHGGSVAITSGDGCQVLISLPLEDRP